MSHKFTKIAVLMGGKSSEADISLRTGGAIVKGLTEAGYEAIPVELSKEDNSFTLPQGTDAVYIALHGAFGEGGEVQEKLTEMGVPYTGCNEAASRIGFDKVLSRNAFAANGVTIPNGYVIEADTSDYSTPRIPLPVVVKPPREGSSVGVSIVKTIEDFVPAVELARKYNSDVLVEEYIPGREWSIPIVCGRVLPAVEIKPKDEWYDWKAKYQSGGTTEYVFVESPEDSHILDEANRQAMLAFNAIGARTLSRVDFRISPEGKPYCLEINTIPGCTETSLLPKAAARAGISFKELCSYIIEEAQCN
ncbi:MAG: D-alanine--D-alanine ligase [Kiritimatiellae bacterium]|nr:D-alanine--D-alanine ligase [Kiritimatiellia bacterium]